jgi:hypothetical protein
MKNLLSHLIHLTVITEFEILFYIYYIVPFERKNIYEMFDNEFNNYNYNYNVTYNGYNSLCIKDEERMEEYNNKLYLICYYYIGCVNFLLVVAFLYDLRKNYYLYYGSRDEVPRVLSSPKYLSNAFSLEMVPQESSISEFIDVEEIFRQAEDKDKNGDKHKGFAIFYWNNSRFIAKICETIQLIILLGVFEYLFFTYLFNKFKIISAKLILCKLLN